MATMLAGALVQVLVDKLAAPLLDEVKMLYGVADELDKLRKTAEHFQCLLREAEKRDIADEALASWLRELQDAMYDADDIIDEYLYDYQRQRVESGDGSATGARLGIRGKLKTFFLQPQLAFRHRMGKRIAEVRYALDAIDRKWTSFGSAALMDTPRASETSHRRETSSLLRDDYVGRSSEKEQIIKTLLEWDSHSDDGVDSHRDDLPVLPIVGLPGVGKTTLAQLIYNDERVKDFFTIRMWVCVHNDFDVKRLTTMILESLMEESVPEVSNLDVVQMQLSKRLAGHRFLLVLDDVRNRDFSAWQNLRAPLLKGGNGSRVLLTTRQGIVAETMGTQAPVQLKGLSFDDCRLLLQRCASSRMNLENNEKSQLSEEICWKIVDRLDGLPLVVKTVGRILSSKVVRGWREILDGEIWESSESDHCILPVLKLSYQDLSPHLKRCFAYCSLFPKRYEFDKFKLVKLWIAQGFVQMKGERSYEDEGNSYFEELLSMSFFQPFNSRYIMYDLFQDLTQHVSNQGCMRIEHGNEKQTPEKGCRHLSFSIPESKVIEDKLHVKMRSLIYVEQYIDDLVDRRLMLHDDIFKRATCLRVLDLSGSKITALPKSVGDLIHLRLLDLSHTRIQELPPTISALYNLFSLELRECPDLKGIPPTVVNLINLHYLNTSWNLISKLPGIGKLTSLQELELYVVSVKDGHGVRELQSMNQLRGRLSIADIQNVHSVKEAEQADLKKKIHLEELILTWSTSSMPNDLAGQVLEKLQPPHGIRLLSVIGNGGSKPPIWMDNHSIYNVTSIRLRYCRFWKVLPPLGTLKHLVSLKMEYLLSVEMVDSQFSGAGVAFPCLENLEIRHMHALKKWLETSKQTCPCLQKILIEDCPKLECFDLPSAIKCLKIEKCPMLLSRSDFILLQSIPSILSFSCSFENSFSSLQSCVKQTLQHLNSLEGLEICFCDERTTDARWAEKPEWLPYNDSRGRGADESISPNLTHNIHNTSDIRIFLLYANNFPNYPDVCRRDVCLRVRNLDAVDSGDYDSVSACLQKLIKSLKQLSVKGCPKLASLLGQGMPMHMEKLEKLEIEECKEMMELEWFPHQLKLTCLRLLNIRACPDLRILPRLKLIALEELQIHCCENLVSMDLYDLTSLRRMEISDCPKLSSEMFTTRLSSLRELRLYGCTQLAFPVNVAGAGLEKLTFLERLEIRSFKELKHLKTNMQAFSCLRQLSIMDCPKIMSLPESGLPPSLKELRIEGCGLLQERCRTGGEDWKIIASIPTKIISCLKCHPRRCRCST